MNTIQYLDEIKKNILSILSYTGTSSTAGKLLLESLKNIRSCYGHLTDNGDRFIADDLKYWEKE